MEKKDNFYNILNTHTQDTSLRDNSNLEFKTLHTTSKKQTNTKAPQNLQNTAKDKKKIKQNIKKIKLIK